MWFRVFIAIALVLATFLAPILLSISGARRFYDSMVQFARDHPDVKMTLPPAFIPLLGDYRRYQQFAKEGRPFGIIEDDVANCRTMTLAFIGKDPHLYLHDDPLSKKLMSTEMSSKVTIGPTRKMVHDVMFPESRLANDGVKWDTQTRVMKPVFSIMQSYATAITELCGRYITNKVSSKSVEPTQDGGDIDFKDLFKVMALKVIGKCCFNDEIPNEDEGRQAAASNKNMFKHVANFMMNPINQLPFCSKIPTSARRNAQKAASECRSNANNLIQARMNGDTVGAFGHGKPDFADCLIESHSNDILSYKEVVDNAILFIIAGHETTAHLLTWIMVVFSQYPDIYSRCRDEARSVLDTCPDKIPILTSIKQMPYLYATIIETLRMYPPIPTVERLTKVPFSLTPDAELPAGTSVIVHIWGIHHRPDYWGPFEGHEDATPFDVIPERHLVQNDDGQLQVQLPKANWIPFSSGPRQCPARQFALNEARLIISRLLAQYDVEMSPGQEFPMQLAGTIEPKHSVMGRLIPRAD